MRTLIRGFDGVRKIKARAPEEDGLLPSLKPRLGSRPLLPWAGPSLVPAGSSEAKINSLRAP